MIVFRTILLLMALGVVLCAAAYTVSGQTVWRQRATQLLKWLVVVGLGFFGLLILRRAAVFI